MRENFLVMQAFGGGSSMLLCSESKSSKFIVLPKLDFSEIRL